MNWTGGAISRSRKRHGGFTNKQKEHFARVRSVSLRNGNSASPKQIELFGNIVTMPPQQDYITQSIMRKKQQSCRREVRRSESQKMVQDSLSSQRCASSDIPTRDRFEIIRDESQLQHTLKRSRAPSSKTQNDIRETSCAQTANDELDFLEARRKRLLNQKSWLSIESQPPLKLRYPPLQNANAIGKRRHVSSQEMARTHLYQNRRLPSPFASRGKARRFHDISRGEQESVRIAIGDVEVRAHTSSNTHDTRELSSVNSISDIMLLDAEDNSSTYQNVIRHSHHNKVTPRMSSGTTALYEKVVAALARQRSSNTSRNDGSTAVNSVDMRSPSSSRILQPEFGSIKVRQSIQSLESAASDIVEIGEMETAVPPSQESDNNMWASWMAPELADSDTDPRIYHLYGMISPGVSERPTRPMKELEAPVLFAEYDSKTPSAKSRVDNHEEHVDTTCAPSSRCGTLKGFQKTHEPQMPKRSHTMLDMQQINFDEKDHIAQMSKVVQSGIHIGTRKIGTGMKTSSITLEEEQIRIEDNSAGVKTGVAVLDFSKMFGAKTWAKHDLATPTGPRNIISISHDAATSVDRVCTLPQLGVLAATKSRCRSRQEDQDDAWLKFVVSDPEDESEFQSYRINLPLSRDRKVPILTEAQSLIANPAESTVGSSLLESDCTDATDKR